MGKKVAKGGSKGRSSGGGKDGKEGKEKASRPAWMEEEEVPDGFVEFDPSEMQQMAALSASTTRSGQRLPASSMPWKPLDTSGVEVAPTSSDGGLVWLEELDGSMYDKLVYRGGEEDQKAEDRTSTSSRKRKRSEEPEAAVAGERKKAKKGMKEEATSAKKGQRKGKGEKEEVPGAITEEEDVVMDEVEYDLEETDKWGAVMVDGVEVDDDYGDIEDDIAEAAPDTARKAAKKKGMEKKGKKSAKDKSPVAEKKSVTSTLIEESASAEADDEAAPAAVPEPTETWRESCGAVDDRILRALEGVMKFKGATECQKQAIERAIGGARHDVLLAAPTGSGKTLAFGIPILHILCEMKDKVKSGRSPKPTGPSALILAPTRELALQITSHLLDAAHHAPMQIVPVIGGIAIPKQERLLRSKPEIIVATPGRLWELISRGYDWVKDISNVRFLVLDEADRMMSMGHYPELRSILSLLPEWRHKTDKLQPGKLPVADLTGADVAEQWEEASKGPTLSVRRQTFVCSATLSTFLKEQLRHKSTAHLRRAQKKSKGKPGASVEKKKHTLEDLISLIDFHRKIDVVDVSTKQLTPDQLKESRIHCLDEEKDFYLYYLLQRYKGKTIVFVNSIDCLRRIASIFALLQCPVYAMHAKMQQRQRLKNLERFRTMEHCALVSSDVTARGIDIPAVDHVIHYQLPRTVELYVHRSGRTARAASSGISVMLVGPTDRQAFTRICKVLGKDSSDVPDFPVVAGAMRAVRKRVKAARALEKELHQKRKARSDRSWYEKAAKEMDIELDDDLLSDEDDAEKHRKNKKHEQLVATLKQRLNDLLRKPLLTGISSARYITPEQVQEMDLLARPAQGFSATADLKDRNKNKRRR